MIEERILELCDLIQHESNPAKVIKLAEELIKLIEQKKNPPDKGRVFSLYS